MKRNTRSTTPAGMRAIEATLFGATPVAQRISAAAFAGITLAMLATPAAAQAPCPAGAVLAAAVTLTDALPGVPNSITIRPNGTGQTLVGRGLTIGVCVTCGGAPLVGAPAAAFTLSGAGVYTCTPAPIADGPTDAAGCTTFTGTIFGGGCSPSLDVIAGATLVGTVVVAVRSPDAPGVSPGFVDAGDLSYFAASLPSAIGSPTFNPCVDFNVDGFVDASDLASFASALGLLGTACP